MVTVDDPRRGIEVFRTEHLTNSPFGVVITDLGMPYLDGRAVARAIKEMAPTTPVILLTGWGRRLDTDEEAPPNTDHVLGKPPKLRELRAALAQCR